MAKEEVFVSTIYGGPQDQQNPSGYQVMRRKGDKAENIGKEFSVTELDKAEALAEKHNKDAREAAAELKRETRGHKKGGVVKSSASKRADGIAQRGKTKGRIV